MTIQQQLDTAGQVARASNKNVTVALAEGAYRFGNPLTVPQHVSLVAAGRGRRSVKLVYDGPETFAPLIYVAGNGYGAEIGGFELIADKLHPNLVFVRLSGQTKNATVRDLRIVHYGRDSIGLDISGESITVERAESRCAVPLKIRGGDNHVFRDMDLGSATGSLDSQMRGGLPLACVWITGMPDHWHFEGSQTWQGGDHAIYAHVDSPRSGSGLFVRGVRYEQSLSTGMDSVPAVSMRFPNRKLEVFSIGAGCRFGERLNAYDVQGVWKTVVSDSTWIKGSTRSTSYMVEAAHASDD